MKKASILFFFLLLGITFTSFSQTPPKDFFAGKWEIAVVGTPRGDVTFLTDLTRKEGKLTGDLVDKANPASERRKITKVEEKGDKMAIFFESSQGGEISIDLTKVDTDNLEGTLMDSYSAKATRLK
jgi:hypothetical protein